MQSYRHAPLTPQEIVSDAYCEIKKYIKSQIFQQLNLETEDKYWK